MDGPPAGRPVCWPATGWTPTLLVSRVIASCGTSAMTLGLKTARQFLRRGVDVIAAVVTAKHIAISGMTMLPPPEPDAWFTNATAGVTPAVQAVSTCVSRLRPVASDVLGEEHQDALPGIGRRGGVMVLQLVVEERVLCARVHLQVMRHARRRQLVLEDGRRPRS